MRARQIGDLLRIIDVEVARYAERRAGTFEWGPATTLSRVATALRTARDILTGQALP